MPMNRNTASLLPILSFAAFATFATFTAAQDSASVSDLSVWRPAQGVLDAVRNQCGAGNSAKLESCFLAAMKNQGASNASMAFAQSMSNSGQIYLNFFRKTGNVSIGYITYVFRANENNGVVLLNGDPSPIDVDDPKYLTADMLKQNPVYQQLAMQHPNISNWPGDRTNHLYPLMRDTDSGGQQALVRYLLKDGCHACANIGSARVAFNFDANGKLSGTKLMNVIPGSPPVTENPVEQGPAGDPAEKGTTHNRAPQSPQSPANTAHVVAASYSSPSRQQAPASQAQSANDAAAHGGAAQTPATADTNAAPTAITTAVGKTFTISLEGNRTTGYSWRLATKLDPKLFKKIGETYAPTNPGLAGSGEINKFTFRATGKGIATILFTYSRPWEKTTPPTKTATYQITID
jgi:predicted secreted protein